MKTSKIKNVRDIKEWKGGKGTIFYHNLEMENGDKINIGKMKEQQVGWELTYEILDTGQEYNKSKAVTPDNFKSNFSSGSKTTNFKSTDDRQVSIIRQSSLKSAVEYLKGAEASLEEIFEAAEKMIEWVNQDGEFNKAVKEESKGRKSMDAQDQLIAQPDDLPF